MATYTWSIPSGQSITGQTYVKDTDNKIQETIDDLVDFVNGEGVHSNQGLSYDFVDKQSPQVVTGAKTFTNAITANAGLVGNVTGNVTGNASTATNLQTARKITLTGDVSGEVSFDGSGDVSTSTVVSNNSHTHTTSNITGLDILLSGKQDNLASGTNVKTVNGVSIVGSGNATIPKATSSTYGTIKAYVSGNSLYITL